MDTHKKQELKTFFEQNLPHLLPHLPNGERQKKAEYLTESLLLDIDPLERKVDNKEQIRQRDADHISAAHRKVTQAIRELEKTSGPEGNHLLHELQKVEDQWTSPTQKRDMTRVYYHFPTIHDKPEPYEVRTQRKKTTGDRAEYIYKVWCFWIREFDKKPSRYRNHPFYELAGILLDIDPGSVHRQWCRLSEEVTKTPPK